MCNHKQLQHLAEAFINDCKHFSAFLIALIKVLSFPETEHVLVHLVLDGGYMAI